MLSILLLVVYDIITIIIKYREGHMDTCLIPQSCSYMNISHVPFDNPYPGGGSPSTVPSVYDVRKWCAFKNETTCRGIILTPGASYTPQNAALLVTADRIVNAAFSFRSSGYYLMLASFNQAIGKLFPNPVLHSYEINIFLVWSLVGLLMYYILQSIFSYDSAYATIVPQLFYLFQLIIAAGMIVATNSRIHLLLERMPRNYEKPRGAEASLLYINTLNWLLFCSMSLEIIGLGIINIDTVLLKTGVAAGEVYYTKVATDFLSCIFNIGFIFSPLFAILLVYKPSVLVMDTEQKSRSNQRGTNNNNNNNNNINRNPPSQRNLDSFAKNPSQAAAVGIMTRNPDVTTDDIAFNTNGANGFANNPEDHIPKLRSGMLGRQNSQDLTLAIPMPLDLELSTSKRSSGGLPRLSGTSGQQLYQMPLLTPRGAPGDVRGYDILEPRTKNSMLRTPRLPPHVLAQLMQRTSPNRYNFDEINKTGNVLPASTKKRSSDQLKPSLSAPTPRGGSNPNLAPTPRPGSNPSLIPTPMVSKTITDQQQQIPSAIEEEKIILHEHEENLNDIEEEKSDPLLVNVLATETDRLLVTDIATQAIDKNKNFEFHQKDEVEEHHEKDDDLLSVSTLADHEKPFQRSTMNMSISSESSSETTPKEPKPNEQSFESSESPRYIGDESSVPLLSKGNVDIQASLGNGADTPSHSVDDSSVEQHDFNQHLQDESEPKQEGNKRPKQPLRMQSSGLVSTHSSSNNSNEKRVQVQRFWQKSKKLQNISTKKKLRQNSNSMGITIQDSEDFGDAAPSVRIPSKSNSTKKVNGSQHDASDDQTKETSQASGSAHSPRHQLINDYAEENPPEPGGLSDEQRLDLARLWVIDALAGRPPKLHRLGRRALAAYDLIYNRWWRWLISMIVFVMLMILPIFEPVSTSNYGKPQVVELYPGYGGAIVANLFFMLMFLADAMIELYAHGFSEMFGACSRRVGKRKLQELLLDEKYIMFYLRLVFIFISLVNIIVALADRTVFRFDRLLRPGFIFFTNVNARHLFFDLVSTFSNFLGVIGVFTLTAALYAYIGIHVLDPKQFYANSVSFYGNSTHESAELVCSVDNFYIAMLTFFVVATLEPFPDCFWAAYAGQPWQAAIIYGTLVVVSIMFLLSVAVPLVYEPFQKKQMERLLAQKYIQKEAVVAAFEVLDKYGEYKLSLRVVEDLLVIVGTKRDDVEVLLKILDEDGNGSIDLPEFFNVVDTLKTQVKVVQEDDIYPYIEFCGITVTTRSSVRSISKKWWFNALGYLAVTANCIIVSLYRIVDIAVLEIWVILFTVFLIFETSIILLANSFKAYWNKRRSHQVALVHIAIGIILFIMWGIAWLLDGNKSSFTQGAFSALLICYSLFVIRFVSVLETMKLIVFVGGKMLSILALMLLIVFSIFYVYVIIGMEAFSNDLDNARPYPLTLNEEDNINPLYRDFGTYPNSLVTVFQLTVGESWYEPFFLHFANRPSIVEQAFTAIYFISYYVLMNIYVVSVVLAIFLDSFHVIKSTEADTVEEVYSDDKAAKLLGIPSKKYRLYKRKTLEETLYDDYIVSQQEQTLFEMFKQGILHEEQVIQAKVKLGIIQQSEYERYMQMRALQNDINGAAAYKEDDMDNGAGTYRNDVIQPQASTSSRAGPEQHEDEFKNHDTFTRQKTEHEINNGDTQNTLLSPQKKYGNDFSSNLLAASQSLMGVDSTAGMLEPQANPVPGQKKRVRRRSIVVDLQSRMKEQQQQQMGNNANVNEAREKTEDEHQIDEETILGFSRNDADILNIPASKRDRSQSRGNGGGGTRRDSVGEDESP